MKTNENNELFNCGKKIIFWTLKDALKILVPISDIDPQ